jgi:carbonic anhydrase/acetyltransferase-like protein (isoleucine patch superfamily)
MIYAFDGYQPQIAAGVYVAPSADVIGRVRLAAGSSVWFGVVLRGDTDWIEIGADSNVQDGTVMHTDPGVPLQVAAGVTIGHRAFLHGCRIGEESLIANGAMVLDRAVVGRRCVIAAGALVPPDKVIPDGSVVMGSPGKIVREVGERELVLIRRSVENYRARAARYLKELQPLA